MTHNLVSLVTVLDGILQCTDREDRILDDHTKPLLESLLEKATTSKSLLEKSVMQHHLRGTSSKKEIDEGLQSEICDAAHAAEDIIESQAVDQMLSKPDDSRFLSSLPDQSMSKVMEEFDAANNKLMEIIKHDQSHEEETMDVINPSLSFAADPTSSKPNIAMVGFDEDALNLKDRLTSLRRHGREIIPIVGMGGIGKTTLARNLYNDPLIVSHFDNHAWVTVSQVYNVRAMLLGLLGCIFGKISDDMLQKNDSNLGLTLYQRLCGRRYLVVLDDVWSEKAWDEIKYYLPNENHKSRILITSRELDVAKYPDSACEEHRMRLLDSAQSWDLLRQKVFEKEKSFPHFLKEIGRKIASDCGGLPLAISVIGGLLSVDKYSKDLWEQVAKDVSSALSHGDEHFSKILYLSYDHLPLHLKPCFLYMAAFPEDFKVRGSKLVKLWTAEGFLSRRNANNKSLEDVEEEYLKALVDRNLLSVAGKKSNGRAASYSMHDLLRDLCLRKADKEKFLCVFKNGKVLQDSSFNKLRRVSVLNSFDIKDASTLAEHLSLARSLLCVTPEYHEINISPVLFTLRLVRVLDVYDIKFDEFPTEILKLVNLRFLAVTSPENLPSGIWRLRNLQTLLVRIYGHYDVLLPDEAWEISGLRHIVLKDTTIYIEVKIPCILEKLQTIVDVHFHGLLASNLINSMPNVKKLGIRGDEFDFQNGIIDLSHLHKLETLKLLYFIGWNDCVNIPLKLPNHLKKLFLEFCEIPMSLVNVLGALQYLEVLKIRFCGFPANEHYDEEWEIEEGVEFCSLRYLSLQDLNIVSWKADYSQFPVLRHLRIRACDELEEIPATLGEISTLEMIEVDDYNPSLVAWAKQIQETQRREYENESLQISFIAS